MRSGALAAALLCIAFGLALARTPARGRPVALGLLAAAALASDLSPLPDIWREAVFLGGWISLILTAAAVYLPGGLDPAGAAALAANDGVWAGALVRLAGSRVDLLWLLPWAVCALALAALLGRRAPIAPKVASSWLIAVAVLAALLPFLPVTPGYMPDHLE